MQIEVQRQEERWSGQDTCRGGSQIPTRPEHCRTMALAKIQIFCSFSSPLIKAPNGLFFFLILFFFNIHLGFRSSGERMRYIKYTLREEGGTSIPLLWAHPCPQACCGVLHTATRLCQIAGKPTPPTHSM